MGRNETVVKSNNEAHLSICAIVMLIRNRAEPMKSTLVFGCQT